MCGSSPFAALGYFSRREKNAWLIALAGARVLLPEGEECLARVRVLDNVAWGGNIAFQLVAGRLP